MADRDTGSRTLLYVDGDERARNRLVAALEEAPDLSIETASTRAEALERVGTGIDRGAGQDSTTSPPVECVVSVQALPDGTGLELLTAVRDHDPDLPFVLTPRDGSERLASEATLAGVSAYLPGPAEETVDSLLECVHERLEEYDHRRTAKRTVNVFDSMMEELPLEICVKDRAARFRRLSKAAYADVCGNPIGKTDLELAGAETDPEAARTYELDLHVIETEEPVLGVKERYLKNVEDHETVWNAPRELRGETTTGRSRESSESPETSPRRCV